MSSAELPFILTLPALLALSAFFSGSETALFGLTQHERFQLRQRGGIGAAATHALLMRPSRLLITILLGNMVVNVVYFLISSVLTLRAEGALAATLVSLTTLLALILVGEVLPKMAAGAARARWCGVGAPLLLIVHRSLGPAPAMIERFIIAPLSRVVRPTRSGHQVTSDELGALLKLSLDQGVIESAEAGLLDAVTELSVLKARDVMTPRVQLPCLDSGAGRDDLITFLRETPTARVLLCQGSIDAGVVGVLNPREFLSRVGRGERSIQLGAHARAPLFVPEQARLDQALDRMQKRRERIAVVLDEYGAVAGAITLENITDRLIAGLAGAGAMSETTLNIERISPYTWRLPGALAAHDWDEAFGMAAHAGDATIAGFFVRELGRIPHPGDEVRIENVHLRVETMEKTAIRSLILTLDSEPEPEP